MMKTIWFDMDGTIADLYGVKDWLLKLRSNDPSPYAEAEVMHNMSVLARYLNIVQKLGYQIGIISWLAKDADADYNNAVTEAKLNWLKIHLPSVHFNNIHITLYGITKNMYIQHSDDILFDDNAEIRNEWVGDAYEPNQIMDILKRLAKEG